MEQVDAGRDECADEIAPIARGFLLALALPSVAVLLLDTQKAGGALKILAEIATLPAFIAVAGWVMGPSIVATARSSFLRAIAPAALCGVTGALVAGAAALPTGHDWRYGLMQAAPAWTLPLLTATYAATARALRHSPFARFLLAAVAHVAGVVSDTPMLTYFIYFAAGLALVSRRTTLLRIADEEQEFAIGSGPLLATLAAAAAFRFAQTGHAASLAAVGPIALAIGLVAGPAALACASALRGSTVGAAFAGLGRAAPALAIFWLPLFSLLIAAANRGAPPSVASALLMATASLLFIVVLVDVLKGAEKTRLGRLFAPS
ncbi:MAG: hypothetical protein V9G24_20355 [Rhodoblastus sp.]